MSALPPLLREPVVTTRAVVDGVEQPVAYHVLLRSGDRGFGDLFGFGGAPRLEPACEEQDFNSLLPLAGDRAALVSHFECVPGGIYVTELAAGADGALVPAATRPVDWDAFGGLWFPCSGEASPWGTHLGSEEYEPDARSLRPDGTLGNDPYGAWSGLLKLYPGRATDAEPYRYGWPTEVVVDPQTAAATPHKRFAMGRFSHELSYALPDGRTVYQSDDGAGVGWFLFVADRPNDLTSGALYAARFAQDGEGAAVSWVPLGSAREDEVRGWVEAHTRFSELFTAAEPVAPAAEGGQWSCPDGFRYAHTLDGRECLQLAAPSARVPDPARVASRLETRRYAAWLGATTELDKTEGVTFDPATGRVYLAMSTIAHRALAEPGEPVDALQLSRNACGAVLGFDTAAGVADASGAPIDSAHVATRFAPVLTGAPDGERCAPDAIANPDNLTFLPGYSLLMVAEDTDRHDNAFLWAVDVRSGRATRILAAPPGGEVTGIHWIPSLLGRAWLTVTVQHPWGELDPGQTRPPEITDADTRAFTGYLGPFTLPPPTP